MLGFSPIAAAPLGDDGDVAVVYEFLAQSLATGQPSIPDSQLEIISNITANDIVSGTPVLGQPTLLEGFGAIGLQTGNPTLGQPSLVQEHSLLANSLVTNPLIVPDITISQTHDLAAQIILIGPPQLDSPQLNLIINTQADQLTTGSPVVPLLILIQDQKLFPEDLETNTPSIATTTILQNHTLLAANLNTAPTNVPDLSLGFISNLSAVGLNSGSLALGQPDLTVLVSLFADSITTGSPTVPNLFLVEGTQFTVLVTGTFIGDRQIDTTWRRVNVH